MLYATEICMFFCRLYDCCIYRHSAAYVSQNLCRNQKQTDTAKYTTTPKDGKIDTFNTVKIIGKGGKVSYRPILPQYRQFFQELIKDKQLTEKLFNLPRNTKQTRLIMSNELRRITKELGIIESGKNHDFRKYHAQLAVQHYISKGWEREKAERFVIQRHLSHSSERCDLKKIYLYS